MEKTYRVKVKDSILHRTSVVEVKATTWEEARELVRQGMGATYMVIGQDDAAQDSATGAVETCVGR